MSKKKERPSWFKMFLHQKALIDAVPDEDAGKALKGSLQYFETGDLPALDGLAAVVFASIKPYIDEAVEDFEKTREKNRSNAMKRWGRMPEDASGSHWMPTDAKDAEAEAEAEAERKAVKASRPRFVPPTVEQVTEYVRQRGSRVDPQGFIDFYASKGWKVGKTPMKDWKAACRNAEHWERWDRKSVDTRNQVKTDADYEKSAEEAFLACKT